MSTIAGLSSIYNSLLTGAVASTVSKTSIPGLAQTAADLSSQSGIVATFEAASSSSLTYDATGLLNSLVQAGTLIQPALTPTKGLSPQVTVQASASQGVINSFSKELSNTLSSSIPVTSGLYTASGATEGLSSNVSANWASILKINPNLSSTVISDSFNQGIVGTLSTTA